MSGLKFIIDSQTAPGVRTDIYKVFRQHCYRGAGYIWTQSTHSIAQSQLFEILW